MQKEIIESQSLLDHNGHLNQTGYAKKLILNYDRNKIRANKLRIKEWDYYLINNDSYALALTIDDNSYMGLAGVSFIDFSEPYEITVNQMTLMPLGKTGFPSTSEKGNVEFHNKKTEMKFISDGEKRHLLCKIKDFTPGKNISADIVLTDAPEETMVIATPFKENPKAFYYNQKINCLRAEGGVSYDGREYIFNRNNSFGVLDWGRGVWTYRNTWYWGSGSGTANGKPFGFNIGYGFGDTTAASENMLFYDGKTSKLDQITFNIPKKENGEDDFLRPWTFTSNDSRFEMNFIPIIDRNAYVNAVLISSDQHQVFGRYSGTAVLDSGEIIQIKDFLGFAEKVKNKW